MWSKLRNSKNRFLMTNIDDILEIDCENGIVIIDKYLSVILEFNLNREICKQSATKIILFRCPDCLITKICYKGNGGQGGRLEPLP